MRLSPRPSSLPAALVLPIDRRRRTASSSSVRVSVERRALPAFFVSMLCALFPFIATLSCLWLVGIR